MVKRIYSAPWPTQLTSTYRCFTILFQSRDISQKQDLKDSKRSTQLSSRVGCG